VIVGDGRARPELEARAGPLEGATTFVGAVEHGELAAYYNAADVFAFPGLREPIGQVYLEAHACGVPVVAFANGGIPELVRPGITGFLVEPLDREAFVDSMARLLDDEALRQSMGAAARQHVERQHDVEDWGRTLAGLLED
jgi:glycosyltransferase involved in cell wall biosynthesis